jgi:hypothetical protein
MKPYLEFIKAVIQDHDPAPELDTIRHLPLERQYVWRVASALKWGLADCESLSVEADRLTLTLDDFAKGDGPSEIPPDAACPCAESSGGC